MFQRGAGPCTPAPADLDVRRAASGQAQVEGHGQFQGSEGLGLDGV
jgi:hypothetical protein